MQCPECQEELNEEDLMFVGNDPFGCPYCGIMLQKVTDDSGFQWLVVFDEG